MVGDLGAASWRPVRLTPGTCFSVAAGAPLPAAADVVVPPEWTDQGMAAVEIFRTPKRGYGVRRAGEELPAGTVLARAGTYVTPALVAVLRRDRHRPRRGPAQPAGGRSSPPATNWSTSGRASQPGQVVDANSHALTAAAAEAGAHAYRVGICDDDPEGLRGLLEDQTLRADLIITTGGTGTGPGDMVRRILSRRDGRPGRAGRLHRGLPLSRHVARLRHGRRPRRCRWSACPATPGAALIGFEVLARPAIQLLAGAEPVFRPSVRAHLLETVSLAGWAARVPAGARRRAARRRLHGAAARAVGRTPSPGWPRPTG